MITSWNEVSSSDKIKPPGWRLFISAYLCPSRGDPGPRLVYAILDTGAPWSVLTEDLLERFCGINDIKKGLRTSVSWLGTTMPAWQHKIKIVVPHSGNPEVQTVVDEFPILCIQSYVRPAHQKPLCLIVFGTDFSKHFLTLLNGPDAKVIM